MFQQHSQHLIHTKDSTENTPFIQKTQLKIPHSYKRLNWKHLIHTKDSAERQTALCRRTRGGSQKIWALLSSHFIQGNLKFSYKNLYSFKREKYLDLPSHLFLVLRMTSCLAAILTDTLDYWSFIINHLFLHLEKNKDHFKVNSWSAKTPVLSLTSGPWETTEPLCHHR